MESIAQYSSDSDDELDRIARKHNTTPCSHEEKQNILTLSGPPVVCAVPPTGTCTVYDRSNTTAPTATARGYVSKRKRDASIGVPECAPTNLGTLTSSTLSSGFSCSDGIEYCKRQKVSNTLPEFYEKLPKHHTKPVMSLNWHSGNSSLLLSCCLDGTCRFWDVVLKKCIASTVLHGREAVSCGQWVTCNTVVTGGFDCRVLLSDVEKGQTVFSLGHRDLVSAVKVHPVDRNLVFSGDYGANIFSWDLRTGKTVKQYVGAGGKILDMTFLQSGLELVVSSDIVRKNSCSQALRIWDVDSTVVLSNQVYSEPYTCPCLQTHPYRHEFYAQSNASYIVVFSSRRPYKCNKHKRYEQHQVEGNKAQFEVSPDGTLLCSASANGQVVVYDCDSGTALRTLHVSDSSCVAVSWNKHTPSTVAVSDWNSNIYIMK